MNVESREVCASGNELPGPANGTVFRAILKSEAIALDSSLDIPYECCGLVARRTVQSVVHPRLVSVEERTLHRLMHGFQLMTQGSVRVRGW